MPRLSPAGMATVSAGPANPSPTSSRMDLINPRRWFASCSVGTPSAISSAARSMSEPLGELFDQPLRLLHVSVDEIGHARRVPAKQRRGDLAMLLFRGALLDAVLQDDQPVPVGPVPELV